MSLPLSPYTEIYDQLIPKDNFLRQMKELIDFSFVEAELKEKYCLDNGRNAESPIRLFKYLLLKQTYNLSDRDLVERSLYDLSFKYFLDLTPEESVIHPTTLTKFRKLRLHDKDLMDILVSKTVELAITAGVINSQTLIVDSTHTASRFKPKRANEYLKEKSKLLRKAIYQQDESMKEKLPSKPKTSDFKEEMTYSQKLLQVIEKEEYLSQIPAVKEKLNLMKEAMDDVQEDMSYSADPDARKGYKSEDYSFHGYKTHIALSNERIVTAAVVTSGEKSDANYLKDLVETSRENGMSVNTIIGDKAYSGKANLKYAKSENIALVAKLHPVISNGTRSENEKFIFNKDADMFVCPAGHLAKSKSVKVKKKDQNAQLKYFFDVKKCQVCPIRNNCYKEGAKTRSYSVTIKSNEHLEQEAFQETELFQEIYKDRYKIESKNSELKNRHGFGKANSSGLFGMKIQGATTIFIANMKRIIKLMNEK